MERLIRVTGLAAAMPAANINTDVIMPKLYLKGIGRSGLADGLFHDLRFDEKGQPRPGFVLNRPEMAHARFLVVGANFGCGSSREHAVWGLLEYGIRAVIGTSFAGIFADNAANNGLLLVGLSDDDLSELMQVVQSNPTDLTVDLQTEHIKAANGSIPFTIDPGRRRMLMLGIDRIGATLAHATEIRAFEQAYFHENPWAVLEAPI